MYLLGITYLVLILSLCTSALKYATALTSLCKLVQLMISGLVPDTVCPLLYGVSLCALDKKNGGIRPVAVGNILRRLTAKLCVNRVKNQAAQMLTPDQYGFGIRNGCKIVSHTVRRFCAFPHTSPQVVCKVNFQNAFNNVRRDVFLNMV